jgi:tetratricopeptide (TPR) repeat protein
MQFDPSNKIIQLCAEGMEAEGKGGMEAAKKLFLKAWEESTTDFEKFTAFHYLARNQVNIQEELKWNLESLRLASLINEDSMKGYFPSLHLNIGKSYDKLNDNEKAIEHYKSAVDYLHHLSEDGYGKMIRTGVEAAVKRVAS